MNLIIFSGLLVAASVVYGDDGDIQSDSQIKLRISEEKCIEYKKLCVPKGPHPEITGGTEAEVGEFPHMALIGWEKLNSEEKEWQCGGTLISERFVMTAAHCTYARDPDLKSPSPKFVRLGEHDISSDKDDNNVQNFEISKIILHPQYQGPKVYNDIALLRLSRDAVITTFVRPACLWQTHQVPNIQEVIASGWGRVGTGTLNLTAVERFPNLIEAAHTSLEFRDETQNEAFSYNRNGNRENRSNTLLKVDLYTVENARCTEQFPINRRIPNGITDTILCAGDVSILQKDTCQGDSGGPLVVKKNDCEYVAIGITAFGQGCGTTTPGAYTRISSYIDWIESEVWLKNK